MNTPPPTSASPPPPPPDAYGSVSGPMSPAGEPLAKPGMRILARFLDGLILGVIGYLVALALIGPDDASGLDNFGGDVSFADAYLVAVIGVGIAFVWDAVATRTFGGSPMKLAFGMRVVRADNGRQVEWSHAITRWAVPGALALIPVPRLVWPLQLIVFVISLVYLFSKPLRQAVWDQVAKTLVVRRRG
jgi:uncharacterized RDD family membrane protein YckC